MMSLPSMPNSRSLPPSPLILSSSRVGNGWPATVLATSTTSFRAEPLIVTPPVLKTLTAIDWVSASLPSDTRTMTS